MKRIDFVPYTQYTIVSMKKYLQELDKVKTQGYAVDNREASLHQICIAAPIFNHNKKVIAAISCVHFFQNHFDIAQISQEIMQTGLLISEELGYSL